MENNFKEKEQLKVETLPTGIKSIPKWIWLILVGSIMIISFGIDLLSTDYPTYILIILAIIVVVALVVLVIYIFYKDRRNIIETCNNLITDYNTLLEKHLASEVNLKGKRNELLEAEEKIIILEKDIKNVQEALEVKSGELESTQDKLKKSEKELKSTKNKLTKTESELQSLKEDYEKNKEQLEETEKELKITKENLDIRENELAVTKEKLIIAEDEISRTNKYLESVEKELHHRRESEVKPIFSSGANPYNHWIFWTKYKVWVKNVGNGAAKQVVGKCIYHTASGDYTVAEINEETIEVGRRIIFPASDSLANDKGYPACTGLSIAFSYDDIYGKRQNYKKHFRA